MRLLSALSLALTLPFNAHAQESVANGTAYGDWIVACQAVTTQSNACTLLQELTDRDTGALVLRLISAVQGDTVILLAQTPIGTYLPGGAVYKIEDDDTPQRDLTWQRCVDQVCEAATALDQAEFTRISAADAMIFGYRMNRSGDPVIARVTLDGYAEGIAAIGNSLP